jgi:thiamine pyrophosphokinase
MDADEICDLDPSVFLAANDPERSANPPDLLILNQPITDFATFSRLWKHSQYRICADGGANRLHDMFVGELEGQRENFVRRQTLYVMRTMH